MKQIILIAAAVLMAVSAYAQYPNTTNKMRLGIQTTGDGLLYRHAGAPNWTPTGINNAWLSIDTLTGDLYTYRNGTWFLEIKGDLQQVYPVVINKSGVNIKRGEVVSVDTSQIVQGDQIRIMRAIGDGGLSPKLIMGVAATDINNNATGYVAWFGYVREAVEANIAETGVTLNVGDILYLSATEPGRLTNVEPTPPALKSTIALLVRKPSVNNLTLLVRPSLNEDLSDLNDVDLNGVGNGQTIVWDSLNMKWIAGNVGTPIDTSLIATKSYVDSKVDSTRLTQDSILVYYIGGVEVGRDTLSLPAAGVTSITAGVGLTGGTITSTGTIAADTATVLVTKSFLTNQGYGTGTVTGSGTTGRVSYWTSATTQGQGDTLVWDNTNRRLGINTTAPSGTITTVNSTAGTTNANFRAIGSPFPAITMEDADISVPSFAGTGFALTPNSNTANFLTTTTEGGLYLNSFSSTSGPTSFLLSAQSGMTSTGTTPVVLMRASKHNGATSIANLSSTEIAFEYRNWATNLQRIMGNGDLILFGTGATTLHSGTTAQRPGTPSVGMIRNNTSNNNLDFYTGTAWENPLKSATATGLGTATSLFFANANGRATSSNNFTLNETNSNVFFTDGNTLNSNFLNSSTNLYLSRNGSGTMRIVSAGDQAGANDYSVITLFKSRGTVTSPTFPTLNQFIGGIISNAYNGTAGGGGTAGMFFIADANVSSTAAPQRITFQTSELLNVNRVERMVIKPNGLIGVNTSTPARLFDVNGEVRISDLTTDTPTRIVGADADGDLGAITVGSGLTLSGGTLTASGAGTTNLTFSGASSPVTLNSDTGTDVTLTAGDGISFSQTSNNLTISKATPLYAVITVDSNRTSSFLAGSVTPDTIDNPILSQVGGVFSVVGNGIQYTSGTARTFLITANADFKFSEANNIVKFQGWRSNGGTVIDLGTFGTVESVLGNEVMHTSFTAITSLSNNDLLRFGFTPAAHTGDDTLVLTNLSITITQL